MLTSVEGLYGEFWGVFKTDAVVRAACQLRPGISPDTPSEAFL